MGGINDQSQGLKVTRSGKNRILQNFAIFIEIGKNAPTHGRTKTPTAKCQKVLYGTVSKACNGTARIGNKAFYANRIRRYSTVTASYVANESGLHRLNFLRSD